MNRLLIACLFIAVAASSPSALAREPCGYRCVGSSTAGDGFDVHRQVPGSSPRRPGTTHSNQTCKTCEWTTEPLCANQNVTSDFGCGGSAAACGNGGQRVRVYFRPSPSAPWQPTGTTCIGSTAAPVLNVGAAALAFLRHMALPSPRPSVQPVDGTVVNKAAIFSAGESGSRTATMSLGGLAVTVRAIPTSWTWTFEPGVSLSFDKPGGPYPNEDVTHIYRQPGTYDVTVAANWTGTFTVSGATTAIAGSVSRLSAPLQVTVREAPAELVSH